MQPPEGDPFYLTGEFMTQSPFKTQMRRALHRDGWTNSLDKLEQVLCVRT
jgi:hypothetical protein